MSTRKKQIKWIQGLFTVIFCFAMLYLACYGLAGEESKDWLIRPVNDPVKIDWNQDTHELLLSNGLIQRSFRLSPNMASIGYKNLTTDEEFLRGVKPEAVVSINGKNYEIGGLKGQPNYAFLKPEWLGQLQSNPQAFQFVRYTSGEITAHIPWYQKRYSEKRSWPPKGKTVSFYFSSPREELKNLEVGVHYNLYQGIPALCKWITLTNNTPTPVTIDSVTTEILAMVERESDVERWHTTKPRRTPSDWEPNDLAETTNPSIHIQSDYAFCGMSYKSADQTTFWQADEEYATQVNYSRQWPHLLTCRYPYGPAFKLKPGETFTSFRTYELLFDSDDKERRGLSIRRLQRMMAPWGTENPIMLHLRYSDSGSIRRAVDQCVETGFEMIILSFGSGLNMESDDPAYINRVKADFDYAHSKGIEIGGYSLLSSRDEGPENNVIDPKTGKPGAYFGNAPCLCSEWGDRYFTRIKNFMEQTGCDILEHDGSYPGDPCASIKHNGHKGTADSQYNQYKRITNFYQWCREKGIYLNVPDYYLLSGSNKNGMGYRETNWSLPRAMQIIHARQNIYDGTWTKAPSMGWMFVPLVEYQGGGAAATIEPLSEHLDIYEAFLVENLLSGVQACYRGPRIYDTEKTMNAVKKWVSFYKKYRDILDSDVIHLRRADGRDYDGLLHVNPDSPIKGFGVFYNPLDTSINKEIPLQLYYTGISDKAVIQEKEGEAKEFLLDRQYRIRYPLHIEPNSFTWITVK